MGLQIFCRMASYYQLMWPTGYVPRWPGEGDAGGARPAMTTLRAVIAQIAAVTRAAGAAYATYQVCIWHSFYAGDPWRLAGPVAAVAWAAAAILRLRRRRCWPAWPLACLDTAFYVTLALSAEGCVPPATRGEAANWLIVVMASQLAVPAWFAPGALSVALALAAPAAYWAGVAGYPAAGAGVSSPGAAGSLLIVAAAVHWCGRRMLYGLTSRADTALAQADRDAREQYVVLSRTIERREQDRLLHDTVLNTLTALSRAGPGDRAEVIRRCRRDVALMEQALSRPADAGARSQSSDGWRDVLGGLQAVAAEMRARGLAVHLDVASGHAVASEADVSEEAPVAGGAGMPPVPDAVASAIVHAAREALVNVTAHAGTNEAWVTVGATDPGLVTDGFAPSGGVQVTIRDAGAGFDPARVGPARLGVRRSITERLADCGGRASVRSAPGHGTVVSLSWPAGPAGPVGVAGTGGVPGASVTPDLSRSAGASGTDGAAEAVTGPLAAGVPGSRS